MRPLKRTLRLYQTLDMIFTHASFAASGLETQPIGEKNKQKKITHAIQISFLTKLSKARQTVSVLVIH